MDFPLFYTPLPENGILDDAEAYHAAKSLRARPGMKILVTNGKGTYHIASLTNVSPKKISFRSDEIRQVAPRPYKICIAVAPTRKTERNEWMLEKLVELGVDEVSFIKTTHTHSESFSRVVNPERMEKIAVAAMKQSRQFFLPVIRIGLSLADLWHTNGIYTRRHIAYVPDKTTSPHLSSVATGAENILVAIGPEGDFTPEEIQASLDAGFLSVSLGSTRLRTETAAIAACHAVHIANLI